MGKRRLQAMLAAFAAASLLAGCAQPPDAATDAATPPQATPPALVGATPAAVTAALGQPALRHTEGPAEVWLYRSPVCGLTVFLFPGSDGSEHVAAATPASGDVQPTSCMASLEHGSAS